MMFWRLALSICYVACVFGVRVRNQQAQDAVGVADLAPGRCEVAEFSGTNCGFPGITQKECEAEGCCYDTASPGFACYPKSALEKKFPFWVMKLGGKSQSSNACEGRRKQYKIPPLESEPAKGVLENWCKKEWPSQSHERAPHQSRCNWNHWPTMDTKKLMYDALIQIPIGSDLVEYKVAKSLSGGVNNIGVFLVQKSSTEASFASFPDKLILKLGIVKDFNREKECMKATYGVDGLPKLYSDAFVFQGTCYKGLAVELFAGKSWEDVMPISEDSECELQETAGRLMCSVASMGFLEMDWNNPSNWIVAADDKGSPKFKRIDLGLCYRHFDIFDSKYRDVVKKQWTGELTHHKWDMMWHMKDMDSWGDNGVALGVGDLILNSQKRLSHLRDAIVTFPGSYVSQIGGEDWNPTDKHCLAHRSDDGKTHTLKLYDLKPDLYRFKATIDPDNSGWNNSVGVRGGEKDLRFRITDDRSVATLTLDLWSHNIYVDVLQPNDISSVSFPGTYVEQLGGKNWVPTNEHCLADRGEDGVTFNLKLKYLKPGEYEFKAVVDPEKHNWGGSIGTGEKGKDNFRFSIVDRRWETSEVTLSLDPLTKEVEVSGQVQWAA